MDESLHYLIMANQMLVQKALLEQLKGTGLTIGQPKILDYLKEHDGSNQKEIAKACFLEAGSLTTILNKMEEKGLIERTRPAENRRIVLLKPTDEAIRLANAAQSEIESALTEIFDALDERALDEYLSAIETINRILNQFPSGNRGG